MKGIASCFACSPLPRFVLRERRLDSAVKPLLRSDLVLVDQRDKTITRNNNKQFSTYCIKFFQLYFSTKFQPQKSEKWPCFSASVWSKNESVVFLLYRSNTKDGKVVHSKPKIQDFFAKRQPKSPKKIVPSIWIGKRGNFSCNIWQNFVFYLLSKTSVQ